MMYLQLTLSMIRLVLGGVRSGKSYYAEQLAKNSAKKVIYIATDKGGDKEMQQRIYLHQQRRPTEWLTLEEPIRLASVLKTHAQQHNCLLVDCLTLWLSNSLFTPAGELQEMVFEQQKKELLTCLTDLKKKQGRIYCLTFMKILRYDPIKFIKL